MEFLAAIDPLLKVLEILAIIGAGGLAVIKMVQTSGEVRVTLGRQNEIISEMKAEMKQSMLTITNVLTQLAVYDNRLERIEDDIKDLRHGRGFIQEQR